MRNSKKFLFFDILYYTNIEKNIAKNDKKKINSKNF